MHRGPEAKLILINIVLIVSMIQWDSILSCNGKEICKRFRRFEVKFWRSNFFPGNLRLWLPLLDGPLLPAGRYCEQDMVCLECVLTVVRVTVVDVCGL